MVPVKTVNVKPEEKKSVEESGETNKAMDGNSNDTESKLVKDNAASNKESSIDNIREIEIEYEKEVIELEKCLEADDTGFVADDQDVLVDDQDVLADDDSTKSANAQKSTNDKEKSGPGDDELSVAFFEGDIDLFETDNDTIVIDDSIIEDTSIISEVGISDSRSRNRNSTGLSNSSAMLMILSDNEDDIVDLSGDEEIIENTDISLMCMKRPPPIQIPNIECVDILDSDEEFPVVLKTDEKKDSVNIEEKKGYVKEYIENEGLGILHSEEHGLVLFHLDSVWTQGDIKENKFTKERLPLGSNVYYYEKAFDGPDYKILCREEVICQAVAVWTGTRPKHLMKFLDKFTDHDWARLEEQRRTFLLYIKGEVFTPVSFVRLRGRVHGYLNEELGLVQVQDEDNKSKSVFFHLTDVRIYKRTLKQLNSHPHEALPVGIHVYVDAKRCHVYQGCEIKYQAISVFTGTWPLVPHPTLLPGGPGTYAPKFNVPEDQKYTFYYLELALESILQKKVNQLKTFLESQPHDGIRMEWRGVRTINCREDFESWKSCFDPLHGRRKPRQHNNPRNQKMEVTHTFKAPLLRHFKTKEELHDGSLVGQHGSTVGSTSCSLFGSRPQSNLSSYSDRSWKTSVSMNQSSKFQPGSSILQSAQLNRTWYNPDLYTVGGLRVKNEIKEELIIHDNAFGQPSYKRFKTE